MTNSASSLTALILDLLEPPNARPRSDILHIAKAEGFSNSAISLELKRMIAEGIIFIHKVAPVNNSAQKPTHVYFRETSRAVLNAWTHNINERLNKIVRPEALQRTGEQYVRSLIQSARDRGEPFGRIPQRTALGQRRINPYEKKKEKADLFIPYELANDKFDLLFESKNEHDVVTTTSEYITKLMGQALLNNAQPVLIAGHLTPKAKAFCDKSGIIFLDLRRQILSSEVRVEAKKLYPQVWRTRFSFINLDRPFSRPRKKPDPRVERDLRIVSDHHWIEEGRATWLKNQDVLWSLLRALERRDWATLDKLID